jgi:hypothetical protein
MRERMGGVCGERALEKTVIGFVPDDTNSVRITEGDAVAISATTPDAHIRVCA